MHNVGNEADRGRQEMWSEEQTRRRRNVVATSVAVARGGAYDSPWRGGSASMHLRNLFDLIKVGIAIIKRRKKRIKGERKIIN